MSTNCLVTKLKGVVNNDNLIGLGEMSITVKDRNTTDLCGIILVVPNPGQTVTVKTSDGRNHLASNGSAKYSQRTFEYAASEWDNAIDFDCDGEYKIIINNKYQLKTFVITSHTSTVNYYFDGDECFYCDYITCLGLGTSNGKSITKLNQNVKKLSLTVATDAEYYNQAVYSLEFFKNNVFDVVSLTNCYGDISNIHLSDLDRDIISFGNCDINGNVTEIIKKSMQKFQYSNNQAPVQQTGTITCDISQAHSNLKFFGLQGVNNSCTWETTRPSSAYAVCLKYVNLGEYVDTMLINQAQCNMSAPYTQWDKEFRVNGTHDPNNAAAVAAIATIKAAGWSVIINGVEY